MSAVAGAALAAAMLLAAAPAGAALAPDSDFARAFPAEAAGAVPPLAAIGVAADGDDTGGSSLAWFGDLRLEAR